MQNLSTTERISALNCFTWLALAHFNLIPLIIKTNQQKPISPKPLFSSLNSLRKEELAEKNSREGDRLWRAAKGLSKWFAQSEYQKWNIILKIQAPVNHEMCRETSQHLFIRLLWQWRISFMPHNFHLLDLYQWRFQSLVLQNKRQQVNRILSNRPCILKQARNPSGSDILIFPSVHHHWFLTDIV